METTRVLHEQRWTYKTRFEGAGVEIDPGPWDDEPDKVQWVDADTGLDCLAVRNHLGAWCGYVGVPKGHRFHGLDHDKIEGYVSVHGGLTFADACDENAEEGHGICHIPLPGRPDDVWWLGFDCGHFMDLQPVFAARERKLFGGGRPEAYGVAAPVYRTLDYVQAECAHLADQLSERSNA